MIIYIDLIILANILVNYIFIKTIKIIFKEKYTLIQILLSFIILTLAFSLFFVPFKYIYNLRYFIGIIIGLVSFYKKDIKLLVIQICIYYLLNISFIGCLVIFNVDNFVLLVICALLISILWFIESFKKDIEFKVQYKISIGSKSFVGYLDTGNTSYCDNIPIVYLDKQYLDNTYTYYKTIRIFSINGWNDLDIYSGPLLCTNKKQYFVYYSFIKSLGKKVILNKEIGE